MPNLDSQDRLSAKLGVKKITTEFNALTGGADEGYFFYGFKLSPGTTVNLLEDNNGDDVLSFHMETTQTSIDSIITFRGPSNNFGRIQISDGEADILIDQLP